MKSSLSRLKLTRISSPERELTVAIETANTRGSMGPNASIQALQSQFALAMVGPCKTCINGLRHPRRSAQGHP